MQSDWAPQFYEFFAGGGMARAGLGKSWRCLFANDFDIRKVEAYIENWGESEIHHGDIRRIDVSDLPGQANLIWASFPCQDLSLAGGGAGLKGNRSGTFWPFWNLVTQLKRGGRAPRAIVLENVCGTLTSHGGKDFTSICSALHSQGYKLGAIVADAALFLPQSRPRLFVIAVSSDDGFPAYLQSPEPIDPWHPKALVTAFTKLPENIKNSWIWWNLPTPKTKVKGLSDIVEFSPNDVRWHDPAETAKLLEMMSPLHRRKLDAAKTRKSLVVGSVYRRTRRDENGLKVQRAEVRFDEVAGCLRTPAGGSSRQILLFVEGDRVRTRLISARETARLMGLPDDYILPERYNEAYHLTGDGVAVPVVRYLSDNLLLPIVSDGLSERMIA